MVNTKRASLLKTAIASGASCWRAPFFLILRRERASKRASLRAVREQTSVDVAPVVRGQWWYFADVSEQAEDR